MLRPSGANSWADTLLVQKKAAAKTKKEKTYLTRERKESVIKRRVG